MACSRGRRGSYSRMGVRVSLQCLLLLLTAYAHATPTKCTLPPAWHDEWFHSGVEGPVTIDEHNISFKGDCIMKDRDRYLLKDRRHGCYRCLVIHQQHFNVLQYKETYCDQSDSLEYVCSLLTGDAQLHSMFRLGATPVPCPFPHTYTFTYNRGHAECTYPLSTVDSCTEDWRILFRYQACPDIQGTESTTEELVCVASWKEGSNRYLVGKSDRSLAKSDEDRYQCFVYKAWSNRTASGIVMAQSGDATCNGLYSVSGGSMKLVLSRVDTSGSKCRFPMWMGVPHWHSLDGHTTLHVTRRNSTLKLTSHSSMGTVTHVCVEAKAHTKFSATYVTRVIRGCTSGYQCVYMITRDVHLMEVKIGMVTPMAFAACMSQNFNPHSTNYTTFVSSSADSQPCPGTGRYEVLGTANGAGSDGYGGGGDESIAASTSRGEGGAGGNVVVLGGGSDLAIGRHNTECEALPYTSLSVGCSTTDTLVISNRCSSAEYSCHGWWDEDGHRYLVVTPTSRSSKGVRRLCLVLDQGSGQLSLASSTFSCSRDLMPGLHGHIALNTTSIGGCGSNPPVSGGQEVVASTRLTLLLLLLLVTVTVVCLGVAPPSSMVVVSW